MSEQKIGRYIIEDQLGEGSFAWVYRGYDEELERHVAIKVLKPMWLSDPQAVSRFKQEARTMAKLHHPGIAVVYEVGESDGQVYLAQFLVKGDTLSAKLEKEGPLPWSDMMTMLQPIASALDYAHEHGIIHRDIKPANILVDTQDRAYLGDFGLVRAAEGSASISASTGGMVGTPAYMAPEQWEGHDVSPATDVYALSCVVVEMLTGSMLFDGATPASVMKQHLMEGPTFPAHWPPSVPDNVAEVLKQGLTEEPSERIQSAGDLLTRLVRAEEDKPTQSLMLPWLVDTDGNRHMLKPGRTTIGRTNSTDITVNSDMISRLHAALVFDGETVTVTDENSANGTFINGMQVSSEGAVLNPGDTLRVGDTLFALNTTDVSATPSFAAMPAAEVARDAAGDEPAAKAGADSTGTEPVSTALPDEPAAEPEPELPIEAESEPEPEPAQAQETIHLTGSEPEPMPVARPEPALAAPPAPAAEPVRATAPPKKSGGVGMPVVGGVIALLVVAAIAGFFLLSGGEDIPPPATETTASGSGAASVGADENDTPTPRPTTPTPPEPTNTPQPEATDTPSPEPTDTPQPEAPAAEPVEMDALINSGYVFLAEGDYEQAIAAFTEAIEADPSSADAYDGRGWANVEFGNYAEAIPDLDTAIELNPDVAVYYSDRGRAYFGLEAFDEALENFEQAIALEPGFGEFFYNRGRALENLGNLEEALASYREAVAKHEAAGLDYDPDLDERISALEAEVEAAAAETGAATEPDSTSTPAPAPPPPTEAPAALSGHIAIPLLANNVPQVVVADIDGNLVNVVAAARQPAHSSDGSRLVVNGDGGPQNLLRTAAADGSNSTEFGDRGLNGHSHPAWSPDSRQVIYNDRPAGSDYSIFWRETTDTSPGFGQELTVQGGATFHANPMYPQWTTQDRIIFRGCNTWAGAADVCGLWVAQGQNGSATQLSTSSNQIPTDVNGNTLLFSSDEGGNWNVYKADITSGAVTQLTTNPSADSLGTLSPDGQTVAFLSDRGGVLGVWAMSIDGGQPEKLFDIDPSWGFLRNDGWSEEKLSWGQ